MLEFCMGVVSGGNGKRNCQPTSNCCFTVHLKSITSYSSGIFFSPLTQILQVHYCILKNDCFIPFLLQDLLQTILDFTHPPDTHTEIGLVSTLRDLAVALSSCIYQSLCDSDSFSVDAADVGIDGFIKYVSLQYKYQSIVALDWCFWN